MSSTQMEKKILFLQVLYIYIFIDIMLQGLWACVLYQYQIFMYYLCHETCGALFHVRLSLQI